MIARLILGLAACLAAGPLRADMVLVPPVDCELGRTCFIQNYVDADPGPDARDFTCGPLVYDGHSGTDFAVATMAQMQAGVAVLAPASGVVTGIRDEMADIASNAPDAPALNGRDCGNGVAIDHGGGWTSQLCHLRRGSVAVRPGDKVNTGQTVGLIGLSGRSEFPHVHLTLRKDGQVVDPFRPDASNTCDPKQGPGLWQDPIAYIGGAITAFGIVTEPPDYASVLRGLPEQATLPADAPALLVWALLLGPRAGDSLMLRLTGPQGAVVDQTVTIEKTQARAFRFTGRKLRSAAWVPGTYRGEISLTRGGKVLDQRSLTVAINR